MRREIADSHVDVIARSYGGHVASLAKTVSKTVAPSLFEN
jgi:hypothetical protein